MPLTREPLLWVMSLAALLALVWLTPGLEALKQGQELFPVWLHTLTELLAVIIAALVFVVAWHADQSEQRINLLVLGAGFFAVALLDIGHLMSYKGMPYFASPASPQKAVSFWLLARYSAAVVLLSVALRPHDAQPGPRLRGAMLLVALAWVGLCYLVLLRYPELVPPLFIEGRGLTPTKVMAEFGVIALMLPSGLLLARQAMQRGYDSSLLASAVWITMLSELCFTLYLNVNEIYSLLGHLYKIIAYLFLFRAVFLVAVREPYRRLHLEIAERRQAEQRLEYLAYHDALTALPNRLLADDHMQLAMATAKRAKQRVAVLALDLDQFKTVNDSLGHGAGDQLLVHVSNVLRDTLRRGDTVCRLGGDEFLLLINGVHDTASLTPMLQQLHQRLEEPVQIGLIDVHTSASIGLAIFPDDGEDLETLQRKADAAMYRAKESGRNTYRFFDELMNEQAQQRMQLRSGLARALKNGEFELHYQPQFCLAGGHLVGAEALLRWQRADGEMVPPGVFIPIAEEGGLINDIGAWVLRQACLEAASWPSTSKGPLWVAVNLSAVQFRQSNLGALVQACLTDSGLAPTRLDLELTESVLISEPERVLATLLQIKAQGVSLSIDDFGTGYSSLAYLTRFPLDRLKIDRSFVADIGAGHTGLAVVQAIIGLARSLGLQTIAEGVESTAVGEELRRLGCDFVQGFAYARPMPAREFRALIQAPPG